MIIRALKNFGHCALSVIPIVIGSGATEAGQVTFSGSILPVLEARCAGCHMTGDEPGNMALISDMAYTSLMRKSTQADALFIVQPGSPEQSYLILKLEGAHLQAGGQGAKMPLAAPSLSDKQIKLFKTWIEQGASRE